MADVTFGAQLILGEIIVVSGVLFATARTMVSRTFARIDDRFETIQNEKRAEHGEIHQHLSNQDRLLVRLQVTLSAFMAIIGGLIMARFIPVARTARKRR